ncbi:MAG TPA: hypothetical protein VGT60_04270 [Candidatus Limnocylindria bacterium]|nr:hypothetical protein [Candidatus Limnocylindria bacterium]
MGDVAISMVLDELGFRSDLERQTARAALEAHGLTRPGKQAISDAKLPRVRVVLDSRFAFSCTACADGVRTAKPAAELLHVEDERCERCGGSDHRAAALRFIDACAARDVRRVVIVGGSPATRRAARDELRGLDVQCVDGTTALTAQHARQLIDGAGLVLLWGGTQLDHKVNDLFDAPRDKWKVIATQRRGLAALLDAGTTHLALRS